MVRAKITAVRTATQLKLAVLLVLFICIVQNGTLIGVTAALFKHFKTVYEEDVKPILNEYEEEAHLLTDGHGPLRGT